MVLFGNSGKNARLLGTALLIITFVAGGLAGAAVVRVVSAQGPEVRQPAPNRGGPMRGGPRRLLLDEQFSKDLGLTDTQRTKIKEILDRRDLEAKKMWDSFEPRLHAFGNSVHNEIQQVLTPEQQKKLDAELERRRGAFKKQRHGCPAGDSTKTKGDTLR